MAQTKEMTTEQAQQKLRSMRKEMREVRAQLDEHATRLEAAGLNGEIDSRDLAAAEALSLRLDILHTEMMALQFSPALTGEPQTMTQSMLDTERELARAAINDNKATREAIGSPVNLLPRVPTRKHRATAEGVRHTLAHLGRANLA